VLLVLLAIPLVVAAGTLSVPNTFTNGTVADADEVNQNFGAAETAINDNDARIGAAESGVAVNAAEITTEAVRASFAESANAMNIAAEAARAQGAEQANAAVSAGNAALISALSAQIAALQAQVAALSPIAADITPANFNQDSESIITLSYTDPEGDLATACSVSSLANLSETTACACDGAGVCTVGVTGTASFTGSASFDYTVTVGGELSNMANASFTINSASSPLVISVPFGAIERGCTATQIDGLGQIYTCGSDEAPLHIVSLSAFVIDKHEVTAGQYEACVSTGPCTYTGTLDPAATYAQDDSSLNSHPINFVNHAEASVYCATQGKRLPTEAEWEKAARGTDGRIFPWGNAAPTCGLAHSLGCGVTGPTATGSSVSGASPYGALNMAGNVSEWVSDHYDADYYSAGEAVDPQGPAVGSSRVVRGGSFNSPPSALRASDRKFVTPSGRFSTIGFRCAQPQDPSG